MKNLIRGVMGVAASALLSLAYAGQPLTDGGGAPLVHMNVAAAGWNGSTLPGVEGRDYAFPDATYLNKWQTAGIRVIRFGIVWERLQPKLNGDFAPVYAQRLDTFLAQAAARNMGVIIDVHNFGRWNGNNVIGTSAAPTAAFQNLSTRIAQRWGNNPGLHGYDLMNEPYGDADQYWKANAQAGINGVRAFDKVHPIYVEGRAFSNTTSYPTLNADLLTLTDPVNNLVYSAHMYLDPGSSGQYNKPITGTFDPMIGVNRAKPFVEWLALNHKRGQIGEFGVPDDDPRWLTGMDNLLSYLHDHCVPLAYWAAGPLWGKDRVAIEPINGVARPQWPVLSKWLVKPNTCP